MRFIQFILTKALLMLSDKVIQDTLLDVAAQLATHTSFTWDDKLVEAFRKLNRR